MRLYGKIVASCIDPALEDVLDERLLLAGTEIDWPDTFMGSIYGYWVGCVLSVVVIPLFIDSFMVYMAALGGATWLGSETPKIRSSIVNWAGARRNRDLCAQGFEGIQHLLSGRYMNVMTAERMQAMAQLLRRSDRSHGLKLLKHIQRSAGSRAVVMILTQPCFGLDGKENSSLACSNYDLMEEFVLGQADSSRQFLLGELSRTYPGWTDDLRRRHPSILGQVS